MARVLVLSLILAACGGGGTRARVAVVVPEAPAARAPEVALAVEPEPAPVLAVDPGVDPVLGRPQAVGAHIWDACDEGGARCAGTATIGAGAHVAAVRVVRGPAPAALGEALLIRVAGEGGTLDEELLISGDTLPAPGGAESVRVPFYSTRHDRITITAEWRGAPGAARIGWIELAGAGRVLALDPPAGLVRADEVVRIELAQGLLPQLTLACGGQDLTAHLHELLARGVARSDELGGPMLIRAPARELVAPCAREGGRVELTASAREGSALLAAGRITLLDAAPPCEFRGEGARRVLITGFDPIAGLDATENSSESAVGDPGKAMIDARVMSLVLPVEWESAAAMVVEAVDRCQPDAVILMGEGPASIVEVELTAYNRRDWPSLADNRGLVFADTNILDAGAAQLGTRLPVGPILRSLREARIEARSIEAERPFVCNEVFYRVRAHLDATAVPVGFVHIPAAQDTRALSPAQRRRVVEVVVEQTVRAL